MSSKVEFCVIYVRGHFLIKKADERKTRKETYLIRKNFAIENHVGDQTTVNSSTLKQSLENYLEFSLTMNKYYL